MRTQQIIAEESGAADVVDPLGGSYYVESLTDKIYESALELIKEIDAKGGAMSAIKDGWQQRQIHNSAYTHLQDVESGKRKIVGVNYAKMDNEPPISAMNLAGDLGEIQSEKLAKWRTNRDQEKVNFSIGEIKSAAVSGSNLFPIIIDSIRNKCTLGEIMNALKDEFGTWMAPSGF